jgi:hypothetical protein
MIASHQSICYNVHFLKARHMTYDETYRVAADYRLTLDVVHRSQGNVLQLPLCLSDFDVTGLSRSRQNVGLKEANRARREVLHWGPVREYALTLLLLCARCFRTYGGRFYRMMRRI